MRRLFWRIFFSFWILLVSVACVLVALDPGMIGGPRGLNAGLMTAGPPRPAPPPGFGDPNLAQPPPPGPNGGPQAGAQPPGSGPLAQQVIDILDQRGPLAADRFIAGVQQRTGLKLYLFDSNSNLVAGVAPDASVRTLAGQALRSGHMQVATTNGTFSHADAAYTASGAEYVLVDVATPGRIDVAAAAIRIVIVVAIATLICWWLSRQITLPILALRLAARDLAAGRFTIRVTPRLGNRRDEISDLARDFDVMAGRLGSMVTAQNRLLGDVSHELRSPLARLSVASAIARRNVTGSDSALALDRVDREVERLNELIGQLMLMSKLELDSASQSVSNVDLLDLVRAVCADAEFEAEALGKRIQLDAATAPFNAMGNLELLRSAVENVVRNALRYAAPGTAVEVNLKRGVSTVIIEVRDHGPGVSEAELSRIFEPFYRTGEARDRDSGGVGLGLAITHRSILRHGGTVSARNAPHGGLIVTIELPE